MGQVEVMNKTIKAALRRVECEAPGIFWDDALYDIVWGMRVTVAQSHGFTPFELVFKQ